MVSLSLPRLSAGLLTMSLLAGSVPPAGVPSARTPADQPQVIRLERFRKALWKVHVTINGVAGDFLFDTGGGLTLLANDFAPKVDCRYWGRTTGYNMFGKRGDGPHCDGVQLKAGETALTPVSVGHIDFGDQFPGDKAPDGLLSLDAFDGKAITIDQVAGTLTIETPASLAERVERMKELPVRLVRDCSARCLNAFVAAPTPHGLTWLILDSGAGGVSLIARDYASAFGLDPAVKEQRLRMDIAPGISVDSPVLVADMIMDGNLGQPFMSQYVLTLDLRNGRLWAAKAGAS
jgi:hypothetical protein